MTLRVAFFTDNLHFGGAERVVVQLAAQFTQGVPHSGVTRVEVHHFGNSGVEAECKRLGVETVVLPGRRWYKSKYTIPLFCVNYSRLLKQRRIQVLHSHLFGAIWSGAIASKLARIGHIGTMHDEYSIVDAPKRIRLLQFARFLGTRVVTVSRSMENYFRQLVRFGPEDLTTIYNGIQAEPQDSATRPRVRAELGIEDEFLVVCVGRLVSVKRHDLLLQAFSALGPSSLCRLAVVGEGEEEARLRAEVTRLGLTDRVRFLGFRADIPRLLAAADCFVLASDSEGLSCSILEAMGAALPVVVTDVGGNRELVTDGENGFLVARGDVQGLAERISELAANRVTAQSMGAAGAARVERDYLLRRTTDAYARLYRAAAACD